MSRVGGSYRPRRAKNVCVCEVCKCTFQSTRYDAKTCSPRCRKRLSRSTQSEPMARRLTINSSQGRFFVDLADVDSHMKNVARAVFAR